ncbi:uncharacterized protein PADG_03309 [Paracoccidioides brasiliensis Pb18]|uniref:Uncharacterized protein n=1 Tax=Paracoccidioides brasiliensis (strain Pb18) TaxID=502780 RepID=C1G804_PARBD|nr:uncharacterized protein PADG_03309 [Paracoccidioides brasiliensis Pb18]EEH47211.2 hypothetical protein PADG_03309 [Paracoccidioides brasiliensis Pb18]
MKKEDTNSKIPGAKTSAPAVQNKKHTIRATSSKAATGPVCVLGGEEYSVNKEKEVKLEESGTRTSDADRNATEAPISTSASATVTNSGNKSFRIVTRSNGNDGKITRTTDLPTTTILESSSSLATLHSTEDVTVTIPPSASSTAPHPSLRSTSWAQGSLVASEIVDV